jgi:hypothetical protein
MTPSATSTEMNMTHGDDPAMQKEHDQLQALVADSTTTHEAKQSGSWFDPNTWVGGKVPGDGAKVSIGEGISVSYDNKSDARLFTVDVEGELKFATNKDTKMVVDTFVVSPEGKLEIGTEANPVQANVKTEILIADNGPIDLNWDPGQLSRGLISHGDVQIHGQAKTSHLKLATDPMAGDRTLSLQSAPTNWNVGDRLVLTGTKFVSDTDGQKWDTQTQDEEVVIQSIEGTNITLDRALKFSHETPRGDLKAYVANQSRNIVIATENADALPNSQRGHTMFMHSDDVDIRYAEFKDLGRTDKTKPIDTFKDTGGVFPTRVLDAQGNPVDGDRKNISGRYSAHLHRTGTDGKPAVMVGNVVDGSPGWGFAVHDSSAILEENVAYDVDGGAFVTESGNETGAFRNNISIKTGPGIDDIIEKQGTGTHDFARTGVGFWYQGRSMENEGNVAAGSRGAGMFYFHRGVDLAPSKISDLPVPEVAKNLLPGGETVNTDQVPIQNFKNNEVFASGNGLHVIKDFPKQTNDLRTVMDGFKAWEVERGSEFQYTSHYTLNNFDLISSKDAKFWQNQGVELQKNTQDFVFNNMKVSGFNDGISVEADTGQGPTAQIDRGFSWIDLKLEGNKNDLKGIEIPPEKWLKSSALTPGRLEFKVASDADFMVTGDDVNEYIDIRGTKTDSLGTIEMPFGDESLSYNYQGVERLAKQGYYELPDGTRATVIEEYFSDRVTGEVKKYPFVVTFKENWWTDGAPYLGKLDPNNIGQPEKVDLPDSRFQLSRGPITSVPPVTPPAVPAPPIEEEAPPIGSPVTPVEGEVPPIAGPATPVEEETPPVAGPVTPVEEETPTTGGPTTPVEEEAPPVAGPVTPVEEETPTTGGPTTPVEEETPIAGPAIPVEEEAPPVAGPVTPVEEETPVAEGPATPVEEETPPVAGPAIPVEAEAPPETGGPAIPVEGETPPSGAPTAPSQPANLEPVVAYDFDEVIRGIAKDTSVGGEENSAELWHGVARSTGLSGNAVTMNGTGSVRAGSSDELDLSDHQQRSISLWFKAGEQPASNNNKQVLYEEGGSEHGLNAYLDDDTLYVGGWDQSGVGSDWEGTWLSTELSGEGVAEGDWNHVALVLDGSDTLKSDALTAYLNGEKIGSGEGSLLRAGDGAVTLGNLSGSTRFHDGVGADFQGLIGSLDEAKIYNQALSGDQVKALASEFG